MEYLDAAEEGEFDLVEDVRQKYSEDSDYQKLARTVVYVGAVYCMGGSEEYIAAFRTGYGIALPGATRRLQKHLDHGTA